MAATSSTLIRVSAETLALNTALQFAELLTLVMPDDPLPRRLVEACRDALTRPLSSAVDSMGEPASEHSPLDSLPARQPEVAASSAKTAIERGTERAMG